MDPSQYRLRAFSRVVPPIAIIHLWQVKLRSCGMNHELHCQPETLDLSFTTEVHITFSKYDGEHAQGPGIK